MSTNKTVKQIRVTGVINNLDSLYHRLWAHFVITPTESYYILEGKKVTQSEMDSLYPVVDLVRNGSEKGSGKDGRTNWMQ